MRNFPPILTKKLLITFSVGVLCFVIGVIYYLYSHDKAFLSISLITMMACLLKAGRLYSTVVKNNYRELVGVCVHITSKPLSKYKKIRIMNDDMNESELIIKKEQRIIIGYHYKFYIAKTSNDSLQFTNEHLRTVFDSNDILGIENLGEG